MTGHDRQRTLQRCIADLDEVIAKLNDPTAYMERAERLISIRDRLGGLNATWPQDPEAKR